MKYMRRVLPLMMFFFVGIRLFAQDAAEPLVITPEVAVRLAVENNLGLESERINLRIKQRNRETAWNVLVPSISTRATIARTNKENSISSFVPDPTSIGPGGTFDRVATFEQDLSRNRLSTGLTLSLSLTPTLVQGISQTVLEYEAAGITLEQAKKRVSRDVQKSFYTLLLLKQNIGLMQETIRTAQRRYEQTQANYQSGLVPELTVLQAQVAVENMKPTLRDLNVQFETAMLQFRQILGLEDDVEVSLNGKIELDPIDLDGEELISRYIGGRLDLASIRKNIEVLENLRKSQTTGLSPVLTFSFSMDPAFSGDPFSDNLFDGDNWSQQTGAFSVTLSFALDPFLPKSRTRVNMANTEDQIAQAQIGLEQATKGALLEVKSTLLRLEKSVESMEAIRLNVQLAQKAYDLSEQAYQAGNKELLEVENSENELQKARIDLLRETHTYITGLLDLEYALNTNLFGVEE